MRHSDTDARISNTKSECNTASDTYAFTYFYPAPWHTDTYSYRHTRCTSA